MIRSIHTYQLSGGTLLEVLTSLSVLSIIFVMGLMIFQNMTGMYSPPQRLKTRALVKTWLYESIDDEIEEERETQGRRLIRRITLIGATAGLYEIEVQAFTGEILLEKRKRVIRHD